MGQVYRDVIGLFDRLDMQQWLLLLVGVAIAGLFFMKGFGSRSSY